MRLATDVLVDLLLDHGLPVSLRWRHREWRVIDQPTPLRHEMEWLPPQITHAPEGRRIGWRFTACAADGEVRIFDVLECGQMWRLSNVWD